MVSNAGVQQFTITPDPGRHLIALLVDSVAVDSMTSYTFTNVTANHTITAVFGIDTFSIAVSAPGGNGGVSPSGTVLATYGETLAVHLTPATGYHVDSVIVDGVYQGTDSIYAFNSVAANHTLKAVFTLNSYLFTITAGPHGTITPGGVVYVNFGDTGEFSIEPNTGYHLDSVFIDGALTANTPVVMINDVDAPHSIRSVFAINSYTVVSSAGAHGGVTPAGTTPVNFGGDVAVQFTPDGCNQVDSVIVDGVKQPGSPASYTFSNVTANHTLRVTFKLLTYTIAVTSGSNGAVSPHGTPVVNCGASQTFNFTPNSCYQVDSVVVDGVKQTGSPASYTFSNVTADHTLRVTFRIITYTLSAAASGGGTVTRIPSQSNYNCGDTVMVVAGHTWRYKTQSWSGDTAGIIRRGPDTIKVIMSGNKSVSASFALDQYITVPQKFAQIQTAADSSRPGDTVAVSPGTYNQYVRILRDSVRFIAVGTLDGVNVKGFYADTAIGWTVRGFVINASGVTDSATGQPASGIRIGLGGAAAMSGIAIENNVITGSRSGIQADMAFNLRVVNNRIYSNTEDGITIYAPFWIKENGQSDTGSVYALNNTIILNEHNGVNIDAMSNLYLVNNVISFNGTSADTTGGRYGVNRGAALGGPLEEMFQRTLGGAEPNSITPQPNRIGLRMINNFIRANGGPVYAGSASLDLSNYGQIFDSGDANNWTTSGTEGYSVSQAPAHTFNDLFISGSPVDLHAKPNTWIINRGANTWNPRSTQAGTLPTTDFEGTPRPFGGTIDIGADELSY